MSSEDDQELAVCIEPHKHIVHCSMTYKGNVLRYWHAVSMTPFQRDTTYVLSKHKAPPQGVFVVKKYRGSSIHYEIVGEA